MPFNFKYYGKTNPEEDPDARPLGEWTWDKLPMDQTPHIDWKTGTVRSPLFNASKPPEIPKSPELDIPDFGGAGGISTRRVDAFVNMVPQSIESETALTDTWPPDDQAQNPKEVQVPKLTRVVYDPATSAILYGFYRVYRYNPDGLLVSISAETRYTIDTPVDVTLIQ